VDDPAVVSTLTCPDVVLGTSTDSADADALSTSANRPLTKTLSFDEVGSKPLPLTVSVPPGETLVAESELMIGNTGTVTVKFVTLLGVPLGKLAALEIEPAGDVTVIAAVVAPLGTTAVIEVEDTADTAAALLPKDTVVFEAVPKPTPEIVTDVPTGPEAGEKCATAIFDVA